MALTEDFKVPAIGNVTEDDLTQMRLNWYFLLIAAANGAKVVNGWATTMASTSSPQDYSKPDSMTLSKTDTTVSPNVTRQLQYVYTWTGANLTTMVIKYDDGSGAGLVTVTGGTITLTYDGSGNFTGATSA